MESYAFIYFLEHLHYINFNFFQIMLRIIFPKMFGILIFRCILGRRVCFGLFLSHYSSLPSSITVAPTQASQPRCRIHNDADGVWKWVLLGDMGEIREPVPEAAGLLLLLPWLSLICVRCLVSLFAPQAPDCSCIWDFPWSLVLGDLLILLWALANM